MLVRRILAIGYSTSVLLLLAVPVAGQPAFTDRPLTGTVRDISGGVLPGVIVSLLDNATLKEIESTVTRSDGSFALASVRAGRYRLRLTLSGFEAYEEPIAVADDSPTPLSVVLSVARRQEQVSVLAPLLELAPSAQVHVDRHLIETLPSESVSGGLSSFVTLTSPGVATDSNGVFHPLGEHAETSFNIDSQPVSDQQSRIFSNQLSPNAIQSIQISTGVPPAELGDKTSLVASVTTRSGLALHRLTGSGAFGFGSFRTPTASLTLGRGSDRLGNFLAADGTTSARFLDTPEPEPLHAHGHVVNLFDRLDVQVSPRSRLQVNVIGAQSSFETPNTYDQQAVGQDQRQRQHTINVASSLSRVLSASAVLNVNGWLRHDHVNYDGSANLFADQPAALGQRRALSNAGAKATLTYVAGQHNLKAGLQETSTWLTEQFHTGVTDPTFNTPCFSAGGDPSPSRSLRDPKACDAVGLVPNLNFLPGLLPFDLTRDGALFAFDASARITQWAVWLQDSATIGNWSVMAGTRLDRYDGFSHATGIQPRLGMTYRSDRTNTIWRAAYGRIFPTPYNENLALASSTGAGGFGGGLLGSVGGAPLAPARRNQYDAGVQQQVWHRVKVDADYFWKLTEGPFDFNVILNTPLTFPVQFRQSKIDGGLVRVTLPEFRGLQLYTTLSHTRSRLFGPSVGGLRFSADYAPVARPDHDEAFQQTTHVEYRAAGLAGFWTGVTWRYDSGLVAVSVPTYADSLHLTGDQQAAMGLYCGTTFATVNRPIRSCDASTLGATRIRIPALGTENDDTNPPRIAPHHLINLGVGFDGITVGDVPLRARVTIVNLFDTVALYNFLSTFAGTHFVTPRSVQVQLTVPF